MRKKYKWEIIIIWWGKYLTVSQLQTIFQLTKLEILRKLVTFFLHLRLFTTPLRGIGTIFPSFACQSEQSHLALSSYSKVNVESSILLLDRSNSWQLF